MPQSCQAWRTYKSSFYTFPIMLRGKLCWQTSATLVHTCTSWFWILTGGDHSLLPCKTYNNWSIYIWRRLLQSQQVCNLFFLRSCPLFCSISLNCYCADALLPPLPKLKTIKLELIGSLCPISTLSQIPTLQELHLTGSKVNDVEVSRLVGLPQLHTLNLASSKQLTDACVAHFLQMPSLTDLKYVLIMNVFPFTF